MSRLSQAGRGSLYHCRTRGDFVGAYLEGSLPHPCDGRGVGASFQHRGGRLCVGDAFALLACYLRRSWQPCLLPCQEPSSALDRGAISRGRKDRRKVDDQQRRAGELRSRALRPGPRHVADGSKSAAPWSPETDAARRYVRDGCTFQSSSLRRPRLGSASVERSLDIAVTPGGEVAAGRRFRKVTIARHTAGE